MGHMSYQALKCYSDSVKGIALDPSTDLAQTPCVGCELGKQSRTSFLGSSKRSDRRLRIVHLDLAGPLQTHSIQGSSYIATSPFISSTAHIGMTKPLSTPPSITTWCVTCPVRKVGASFVVSLFVKLYLKTRNKKYVLHQTFRAQ
jgi:hypothetical protein